MSKIKQKSIQVDIVEEKTVEQLPEAIDVQEVESKSEVIVEEFPEPVLVDVLDVASRYPNFQSNWEGSIRAFVQSQGISGKRTKEVWVKVLAIWGIKF